jgi:hypothetical protein
MNDKKQEYTKDILFVLVVVFFFFGCIATTHHTAKTVKPKQVSFSSSYLQARPTKDFTSVPVQLIAIDGRTGLGKGCDMGVMHTWDASKNNDNAFATMWGDFKVQLSNRDQSIGKPIFSTGLIKGYIYHEDAKIHATSLPLMVCLPVNERITPFFNYRYGLFSDKFIPESFMAPRHTFVLGIEFCLSEPSNKQWTPKLSLCIGRFNSLIPEENETNPGLMFNVGFTLDSPY